MNRLLLSSSLGLLLLVGPLAVWQPSMAVNDKETLELVRQAYQSLQASEPEVAIRRYDEAIGAGALSNDVLANAYLNRALAKQRLKQLESAVSDYSAALATDALSSPVRSTALYNRGLAHHKLGKLPQAIEDYTSALLLNPQLSPAFLSRGQALRESGQLLFALSDFERALISGHADVARVNYLTGLTYEQLSRIEEARKHYEAALHVKPDYKQAQERLAQIAERGSEQPGTRDAVLAPISRETELRKLGQKPAIQPPERLLAASNAGSKPISERASSKAAELVKGDAAFDPNVTASITPAAAAPEAQVGLLENNKPSVEPVAPESPAMDTVASATLPQNMVSEAVSSVTEEPPGWSIQIASATSLDGAKATWDKMQAKSKALQQFEPAFVKADLGTKGIVFRVRIVGFDDKSKAQATCKKLKANSVDCFVSRS
jgi:tetratricopeptide (TPR) repeat protein